jgi:tetratricopeptide (TPR) repeat protein
MPPQRLFTQNMTTTYTATYIPGFGFYVAQVPVRLGVQPDPKMPAGNESLARRPTGPEGEAQADKPVAELPDQTQESEAVPEDFEADAAVQKALRAGNAAFALGQYQNALKQYEQAQAAAPLNPLPAFHIGQVYFAQGQYGKAVAVLQRGLKWHAKWPEGNFAVRALYGDRTAAFQEQLDKLAQAVEANPADDSLLFLLGYQLWFDGKREEAVALFKRASALRVGGVHLDRFLRS